MKLSKLLSILLVGVLTTLVTSCENQDVEFPDYEGGTSVYFAYQYPVRTIVLGDDTYDTSLDNEHRCEIYATMGGVYTNKNKISIDFVVDNNLCDKLFFENGSAVTSMPSNYYTLDGNQIILDHKLMGAVGVQLQDAFFADPKAMEKTYVIPLLMTKVQNADRILTGRQLIEGAPRTYSEAWDIQPQDYVLYCLKFINQWHAKYLRRGIDHITENGVTSTNIRRKQYVEDDEICSVTTAGLKTANYPISTSVSVTGNDGSSIVKTLTCNLLLNFNDNNECTISSTTEGYTASGSGKFVKNGDKNSWGNKDRNVMYLEYNVDFGVKQYATKDTLVVQTRDITAEWFTPSYKVD
ncbi:DUF1735 domain-containing protein [Dysgonomonas sp. Marseille-P4677]|uniref:DUF5627 domain-containing protein n=1 Tax=Dysgonomonas sp. Marseille-P4677 TaxID=2364790 RepID=UPI0019138F97|nr:DUF5627 domain-containing protein [Dysgonomonas sp. Marseille-P4677]MBK5721687.1 DUF1735 domain-containing protein [Dysgonomonas sp. Marseille-P4677]